jgi:hypothetical protein
LYRQIVEGINQIVPVRAAVIGEEAIVGGALASDELLKPIKLGHPGTAWPLANGELEWFLDGISEADWF